MNNTQKVWEDHVWHQAKSLAESTFLLHVSSTTFPKVEIPFIIDFDSLNAEHMDAHYFSSSSALLVIERCFAEEYSSNMIERITRDRLSVAKRTSRSSGSPEEVEHYGERCPQRQANFHSSPLQHHHGRPMPKKWNQYVQSGRIVHRRKCATRNSILARSP